MSSRPENPFGPAASDVVKRVDALATFANVITKRTAGAATPPADPKGASPTGPEAVAELESYLKKVPSRVLSPAGKARVPERVEQLTTFLRELRQQTDNVSLL